jgi:NAD(P)H-dependent FMN reductase
MANVLVIPGSWRKGSLNAALAQAAAASAPAGCTVTVTTIRDIPLYDGDVESSGIPAAVSALKDAAASADGVLLVSPEYNNSVPGTLKNAIDWLSRPPKDGPRVFRDRAFGVIGATLGPGGTRMAQAAWLPILRALGAQFYSGASVFVADGSKAFDAAGQLTDAKTREILAKYMQGFDAFAACTAASRKPA